MFIVSSIKHFHVCLYGHHFKVRSDHSSLGWLMNFNILEGQTARFLEFLSSYDFHVEHSSDVTHRNADALSRRLCSDNNCEYCEKIERRNEVNDFGLIQENQIPVERSSVREPGMKDGMLRCTTIEMDALVPSSLETGKSRGSVKVQLHEPSYEKDIPNSCSDNIPQVIYSTQNSQMSQGGDRNCSTKTVYPSKEQFSKFDVNYEQSQVDGASLHNVVDNVSDLDTHNE